MIVCVDEGGEKRRSEKEKKIEAIPRPDRSQQNHGVRIKDREMNVLFFVLEEGEGFRFFFVSFYFGFGSFVFFCLLLVCLVLTLDDTKNGSG